MSLSSATPLSLTKISVSPESVLEADAFAPWHWQVTAREGHEVVVHRVTTPTGGVYLLEVYPPMSPGGVYDVDFVGLVTIPGEAPVLPPLEPPAPTALEITVPDAEGSNWFPDHPPHHPLRVLTRAFAEEAEGLSGSPATRLVRQWYLGDLALYVESAVHFPADGGRVFIGGEAFTYKSVHPSSVRLDDVRPASIVPEATGEKDLVVLDNESVSAQSAHLLSKSEQLLRSTLINYAEGRDFDDLAQLFGFPRPRNFSREVWRGVLKEVAYASRGTAVQIFAVLKAMFSEFATTYNVVLDENLPRRVFSPDGFPPSVLDRYVEIRYLHRDDCPLAPGTHEDDIPWTREIFWTTGPHFSSGTSPYIELLPVASGFCRAGDWSRRIDTAAEPAATFAELTVLPFLLHEPTPGPGQVGGTPCEIQIFAPTDIQQIPPTYFLDPAAIDREDFDPFMPPGGIFLEIDSELGEGNQEVGPYPIYFCGDTDGSGLSDLISRLLHSGVRARVHLLNTDE